MIYVYYLIEPKLSMLIVIQLAKILLVPPKYELIFGAIQKC